MLFSTLQTRAIPMPVRKLLNFQYCPGRIPLRDSNLVHKRQYLPLSRCVLPAVNHRYLLFSTAGNALGRFDMRPFLASSISML
jgi:hypothetical protein